MSRQRRLLVVVSSAQLAAGFAGQVVALRRQLPFNVAVIGWRGRPDRVAKDSWLFGTGVSAPVVMLALQAAATVRLARAPSGVAARTLGILGALMVGGYLVEAETRKALGRRGRDPVVTPVAAAGLALAAPMAYLGLGGQAHR